MATKSASNPTRAAVPSTPGIDAAIAVHHQLGLTQDTPIAEAVVSAPPPIVSGYFQDAPQKRRPTQIVEAQFAYPFLVATGLLQGRVGIDEVARFDNPAILALSDRVTGVAADGPVSVFVRLADGRSARQSVAIPLGAPENPLSTEQRAAKFRDCAAHAVRPIPDGALANLLHSLSHLETEPDARVLLRLLE